MTSLEFLFNELWESAKDKLTWHTILNKAKEMHKQEIIDAYETSHISMMTSEQYYQETFVSKGNDEHIVDTNEMIEVPKQETLEEAANIDFSLFKKGVFKWQQEQQLPQQEISDKKTLSEKYQEYKDWLNEIPKISEDEILTEATNRYVIEDEIEAFIKGANWIQEKLKI